MGLRYFAAVVPPSEVVAALVDHVGRWSVPGRPVAPRDWHVTLRFVGTVEEVTYERWLAELDQSIEAAPFRLTLTKLGAFPRPGRATVAWIGVEGPDLPVLALQVDRAADAVGIGPEERPYRPHLTIARLRPPADMTGLVESSTEPLEISWTVTEYHVMAAVNGRYRALETFVL